MPVVSIPKAVIAAGLSKPDLTDDEFSEMCFSFGIELDDVTTEKEIKEKETGRTVTGASSDVLYKIEIPANRYDLLCPEGLLRALRVFKGLEEPAMYKAVQATHPLVMNVHKSTASIRPFVVCAVLRGVEFTPASYQNFIDLQEKLHQNVCRKRTLVAIGTHDLDTIEGPFSYEALAPADIRFVPLKQTAEVDGNELMKLYETDNHLKHFLPIIRDSPVYPVIFDNKRRVLSLPPIINSAHSRITLQTRNVFIECTATDLTKANVVLNTMVSMFSQYCSVPFTCESVNVRAAEGTVQSYPQLEPYDIHVSPSYINESIGLSLSVNEICALLKRMQLPVSSTSSAAAAAGADDLIVNVPCTRSDVLHGCDIMEDVAISYGFDNIKRELPPTISVGQQFPLNKVSDLLRGELAQCGYTELLTFALTSKRDNFESLCIKAPAELASATVISNPQSSENQIVRTNLLNGVLKTLESNRGLPLPVQLFEISDVVVKDSSIDTGARNERRLCASYSGTTSGFQLVHGLLDRIMLLLEVPADEKTGFSLAPLVSETFLAGRAFRVLHRGVDIGVVGVLHPLVLENFGLKAPTSIIEINIEPFV